MNPAKNKKEFFDEIIPIGGDCSIGEAISHFKYRKCSYPLDWNISTIDFIKKYFGSKLRYLESVIEQSKQISNSSIPGIEDLFYFQHDAKTSKESMIKKYKKRNNRLNHLLESDNKILFVRKWPSDTVRDMLELKSIINSVYPNLKFKILILNNIKGEIVNDQSIIHHYCESDCFLKKNKNGIFSHTNSKKSYESMRKSISQFTSNKYKQPKNIRII